MAAIPAYDACNCLVYLACLSTTVPSVQRGGRDDGGRHDVGRALVLLDVQVEKAGQWLSASRTVVSVSPQNTRFARGARMRTRSSSCFSEAAHPNDFQAGSPASPPSPPGSRKRVDMG